MPLNDLLKKLYSDENRLALLRKVYHPGNAEVANEILSITPQDSSVLESEMEFASEHGMEDRFVALAKKFVDSYVRQGFDILLKDKVIKWSNTAVASYTIAKLEEKNTADTIEYAADIAKHFGIVDEGRELVEKQLLEKLLKRQLKKKYLEFAAAETSVKLGLHTKAVDLYTKAGYHWLDSALKVAKEHVPDKLREVAQMGLDRYESRLGEQKVYLECAEILGKTEEAKKTLIEEAKKLDMDHAPRFYKDLVTSLVKLGLLKDARDVVSKVAKHESKVNKRKYIDDLDKVKELGVLYHEVGIDSTATNLFLARIDKGLREKWNPSNIMADINEGYELTGAPVFLERKLRVLESEGKYGAAGKLAAELGRYESVDAYNAMQKMVQEAEAASGQRKEENS